VSARYKIIIRVFFCSVGAAMCINGVALAIFRSDLFASPTGFGRSSMIFAAVFAASRELVGTEWAYALAGLFWLTMGLLLIWRAFTGFSRRR
jgi:hypothetical protein